MGESRVAIVVPAAARTWEVRTILPQNTVKAGDWESDPVVVTIPRPVCIVAAYPSLSLVDLQEADLGFPVLDDVLVHVSVNNSTTMVNRFDVVSQPGGPSSVFVSLGAFRDTTGGARRINMRLEQPSNELIVKFRWKAGKDYLAYPWRATIAALAFELRY